MKTLIYGFGPYKQYKENITEKIIKKIRKNVVKVVFPVKSSKKMFLEKIKKYKPDVVLGLGQHGKSPVSTKLRIERKAVNLIGKKKLKIIFGNKPKSILLNLKLKQNKDSWVSYNAGRYVCNFSMFIISAFCKNMRFAFIHVPKDYNLNKAVKFVENKIDEIS